MILRERLRWALAFSGPLLLAVSSLMPIFGQAAKWAVRCRGREFSGEFDDCFNDYLPLVEMIIPIVVLMLLYPFAKFAFVLFSPDEDQRSLKWRLAPDGGAKQYFPSLHVIAALGVAWSIWRASTYPLDPVTMPYLLFWISFAVWFLIGIYAAWPNDRQGA